MRGHRTQEHQEAVSRRLALLSAELEAVRAPDRDPTADREANPWAAPATHTRLSAERRDAQQSWREPPTPTRIRPGADDPGGDDPGADDDPPPVPMPGRHARRRAASLGTSWPGIGRPLPEALRGRASLGAPQVVVVLVLVAVGLAMTCWWLVRGSPEQLAVPPPAAGGPSPLVTGLPTGPAAGGSVEPGEAEGVANAAGVEVVVDVAGKVRRPGIAVLDAGSRVVDALEAAGGARAGVDLTGLNLARVLVDGEQILVGVRPAPGVSAGAAGATSSSTGVPAGGLVPLNTADQVLLESLPDVGPVTAEAILSWRDEHGAFTSVDELLEVDGIGEATLARLAPLVTL